ncbi:MAG TPA: hypothetical protein IAD19_04225 [Candidatus Egerieicola faecale]|uniref:Uncharacterized protein n=1 Tax=Candidatus Egerieicola faecale TaxID=2840774 RepID=A0A9D1LJC8_9FIRM|nr:hypothetical protein [Candidatus Egerieicola faecale]
MPETGFLRQKNAARRFRAAEVVEKGFGMFETSLRHVSGLTCPWLYAIGQADSILLFPQPFFKNKFSKQKILKQINPMQGFHPLESTA